MTKNRFGLTAVTIAFMASALGAFTYGCVGGDDDSVPSPDSGADTSAPPADAAGNEEVDASTDDAGSDASIDDGGSDASDAAESDAADGG